MGVGGISIWQLLIILAIVVLLFGTKRLKNIGSDLGEAIRGFRSSMSKSEQEQDDAAEPTTLSRDDASAKGQAAKQESVKSAD